MAKSNKDYAFTLIVEIVKGLFRFFSAKEKRKANSKEEQEKEQR